MTFRDDAYEGLNRAFLFHLNSTSPAHSRNNPYDFRPGTDCWTKGLASYQAPGFGTA